jgi:dolichyl-phosphate beta-glucosyltransferase
MSPSSLRAAAPALSIVIPAFNEERRLGASLQALRAFLRARRLQAEVLVVDDGSTDATVALVQRHAKSFKGLRAIVQPGNLGKGAAVKAGVLASRGRLILFSDADLSTPLEELDALQKALRAGADIAIGSRALDRARIRVRQPLYREWAGRLFNRMVRLLSVKGISDTQCGFKLFKAAPAKRLFAKQQVSRFGFDVEILYLARQAGYRIAEVPVRWFNSPETKVRPIRDGGRAFIDLALIRLYQLQGRYRGL